MCWCTGCPHGTFDFVFVLYHSCHISHTNLAETTSKVKRNRRYAKREIPFQKENRRKVFWNGFLEWIGFRSNVYAKHLRASPSTSMQIPSTIRTPRTGSRHLPRRRHLSFVLFYRRVPYARWSTRSIRDGHSGKAQRIRGVGRGRLEETEMRSESAAALGWVLEPLLVQRLAASGSNTAEPTAEPRQKPSASRAEPAAQQIQQHNIAA
jgi:hypothetical protein